MAPRTYLNFDLLFEPEGEGTFRARVVDSPDGSHPFVDFSLPFDPMTLENLLLRLDPGRSGTRRAGSDPQVEAGRRLGGALFDAVFTDQVALAWARAKDAARARSMGVRLRLHLGSAPALSALPWELLYDERVNTFLAQSERTPVVRFLDIAHSQPPLRVDGPLRILVVVAAPTDLPDLDVEAEWAHVLEALAPRVAAGQVVVDRLPGPTLTGLGRWLRSRQVHVLHFVGHGDVDPRSGDGVLYFCDDYGRGTPVSASVLGPYVVDHDPLRLLVLNACRSASTAAADPFSGIAQGLVQQEAAAVVAMQFPITDRAAAIFTREFYGALTDGFPVDQAVSNARKALWAGFGAEWATPTVFLHTRDGHIFDTVVTAPADLAEPSAADAAVGTDEDPGYTFGGARRSRRRTLALAGLSGAVLVPALTYAVIRMADDADPADAAPDSPVAGATGSGADPTPDGMSWANPGAILLATRFETPPSIDGSFEDWEGLREYESYAEIRNEGGQPAVGARWKLGWDADNLYLSAVVDDQFFSQTHADSPADLWQGDSVHFEFGRWTEEIEPGGLHEEDVQVMLGPTGESFEPIIYRNVVENGIFVPGAYSEGEGSTQPGGDAGYAIEAAIPWSELTSAEPGPGARFAANFNVSDARGGGELEGTVASLWSTNPLRLDHTGDFRYAWGELELTG